MEAERRGCEAEAEIAAEVVRPGLWSLRVVIPDNPLGYTLVYLFETRRGPVLVDTGWPHPDSWQALLDGIVRTGHRVEDVYGVLSTHHHNDHHGLAGRVREVSGAWVAMHEADARAVERRGMADEDWYRVTRALMVEAGAPQEDLAALPKPAEVRRHFPAQPDRLLDDGEQADVPGGPWRRCGHPVTRQVICASPSTPTSCCCQETTYCPISPRTSGCPAARRPATRWLTTLPRCIGSRRRRSARCFRRTSTASPTRPPGRGRWSTTTSSGWPPCSPLSPRFQGRRPGKWPSGWSGTGRGARSACVPGAPLSPRPVPICVTWRFAAWSCGACAAGCPPGPRRPPGIHRLPEVDYKDGILTSDQR